MDGSFACPECGSPVEVAGLAPGRQVRCAFCQRLLEVPFFPRVPSAGWKRRRFAGWRWVRWAWAAAAIVAAGAAIASGVRFLRHQVRDACVATIHQMIASSRDHEAEGRFGQALVELDAALDLLDRADQSSRVGFRAERDHRADLARRDVEAELQRLVRDHPGPYPVGEWLTLIERSRKDDDLTALRPRIEQEFRRDIRRQAEVELASARRDRESGHAQASMDACDRIAAILPHLEPRDRAALRQSTGQVVEQLVAAHGVSIENPRGDFVHGTHETYRARLLPVLIKALEAKGYLPLRERSSWRSAWGRAAYRMQLDINEHREGNYLSSQNRLTRIEARLNLSDASGRVVWRTMPSARTTVPLPGLSAYHSSRLAISPARSDELERLLYDNARGQIEARFSQALGLMPACCP